MSAPGTAEPIRSDTPGSFPWTVLHDRHPALLQQVRDAYPYPPDTPPGDRRAGARDQRGDRAADRHRRRCPIWAQWARDYLGRSWYEVPFLWAENYFYRSCSRPWATWSPAPGRGSTRSGRIKAAELAGATVDAELVALDGLWRR